MFPISTRVSFKVSGSSIAINTTTNLCDLSEDTVVPGKASTITKAWRFQLVKTREVFGTWQTKQKWQLLRLSVGYKQLYPRENESIKCSNYGPRVVIKILEAGLKENDTSRETMNIILIDQVFETWIRSNNYDPRSRIDIAMMDGIERIASTTLLGSSSMKICLGLHISIMLSPWSRNNFIPRIIVCLFTNRQILGNPSWVERKGRKTRNRGNWILKNRSWRFVDISVFIR